MENKETRSGQAIPKSAKCRHLGFEVFRNSCSQLMRFLCNYSFVLGSLISCHVHFKSECVVESDSKIPFRKCLPGDHSVEFPCEVFNTSSVPTVFLSV